MELSCVVSDGPYVFMFYIIKKMYALFDLLCNKELFFFFFFFYLYAVALSMASEGCHFRRTNIRLCKAVQKKQLLF